MVSVVGHFSAVGRFFFIKGEFKHYWIFNGLIYPG